MALEEKKKNISQDEYITFQLYQGKTYRIPLKDLESYKLSQEEAEREIEKSLIQNLNAQTQFYGTPRVTASANPYCGAPRMVATPSPYCGAPRMVATPNPYCGAPRMVATPSPYCGAPRMVATPSPYCGAPRMVATPSPYCGAPRMVATPVASSWRW